MDMPDGRKIIVKYKNASQAVGVEKFVGMVLASRIDLSREVEVLKAESIMIRTDILRLMADNMSMDSDTLNIPFLTNTQMKKEWGDEYESNYSLIMDCVNATAGMVIKCDNAYIDARYTQISAGTTLNGAEILGESYAYLIPVKCEKDMQAPEYLTVKTIGNKEFAGAFEKAFDDLNIDQKDIESQVQVVMRTNDGYIQKIQVGNVVMTGSTFAKLLGINSAFFKLEFLASGVKVTTMGKGEGFGVSLYSADSMAKEGMSYEEILQTFYSKITILSE